MATDLRSSPWTRRGRPQWPHLAPDRGWRCAPDVARTGGSDRRCRHEVTVAMGVHVAAVDAPSPSPSAVAPPTSSVYPYGVCSPFAPLPDGTVTAGSRFSGDVPKRRE